ncbi:hypothetical protein FGRMN_4943 [Fusarium graminum]|nr:hypothetical protein FGRMN_4943 [Fusarium graminum]
MTLVTYDDRSDASSISTDIIAITIDSLDFEDIGMYESPSLEEIECESSTTSSPLRSRPPTPLSQAHLSAVGRWEDLTTSYLKAVQLVRQIEDEMFDLRYRTFHPYVDTNSETDPVDEQPRQQADQRDTKSLPVWNLQMPGAIRDQDSPTEIFQDRRYLDTEFNDGVEFSVVSLDTLQGKKTMLGLSGIRD